METIFIKHPITDEDSLPKKQGKYFVISKGGGEIYKRDLDPFIKFWMNDFECWLEEKELPTNKEIKKECKDYDLRAHCGHFSGDDPSSHFESGISWFKSKLGIK